MDHEEAETAPIKYVFLDVVGFTKDRSTEAQVDIIKALNAIVRGAVASFQLPPNEVMYLPTGDGMCIALVSILKPYDVHVLLALKILEGIKTHNDCAVDGRKFFVRIGLNECDDTLVTDVNGHRNVAGSGINTASRIMGLADAAQILMSVSVFEKISSRERYQRRLSEFSGEVKHGNVLKCYQLKDDQLSWLNSSAPSSCSCEAPPEPKLTLQMAFFMSLCVKHRPKILDILKENQGPDEDIAKALLWLIADDLTGEARAKPGEAPIVKVKDRKQPLAALIERYQGGDFWFTAKLAEYLEELYFAPYSKCFEEVSYGLQILIPSLHGLEKLRREFPKVFKEVSPQTRA